MVDSQHGFRKICTRSKAEFAVISLFFTLKLMICHLEIIITSEIETEMTRDLSVCVPYQHSGQLNWRDRKGDETSFIVTE